MLVMLPDLADGIYNLSYHLPAELGTAACGLAIVRDKRIIGSDPEGGVFEGHLESNEATGAPCFQGVVTLPPAGELITGLSTGLEGLDVQVTAHAETQDGSLRFVATIAGEKIAVDATYLGPLPEPTVRRRTQRSP